MAIKKSVKKKSLAVRVWRKLVKLFLVLFAMQLFYIVILKWVDPPVTITQLQNLINGNGLSRDYVPATAISYHMKLAVIASEDQLFPDHGGFDWKSIKKAMAYNEKKPNRIRGASTISQQVAKNVFLWQGRDWVRKGLEVYFTKMIEWVWGKRRILEVYLNVIETGKGVFGVEAASQKVFGKKAVALTRNEAALIAAVLPNPKKYNVMPFSKFVLSRRAWVLQQMKRLEGDKDLQRIIR